MELKHLITMINNLIAASNSSYEFKIYDTLSMDYDKKDVNKINGIANIINGSFEPTPGLGQSALTVAIEFIYQVERLPEVKRVLTDIAKNSAGLIFQNSLIDENLVGVTSINIVYPEQGQERTNNLGETITSEIICFFVVNEKNVLSNECKFEIEKDVYTKVIVTAETEGTFYNSNHELVTLPEQYSSSETYYTKSTIWENIVFYKAKITRVRSSETNDYRNSIERRTINVAQSIDIGMLVPSIRDSKINQIKKDMNRGLNINEVQRIRYTDDDGQFIFENMIASGPFTQDITPGQDLTIDIHFVYRKE